MCRLILSTLYISWLPKLEHRANWLFEWKKDMGHYKRKKKIDNLCWFTITSVTNYHKLNGIKQHKINTSQIFRLGTLVDSAGASALGLKRPKLKYQLSWAPT